MVIAGEVSGDLHAAHLVQALRDRAPAATFFGIGGDAMRAAGVQTEYDVNQMAVTGFSEVFRRFRFFARVFHHMLDLARTRRPDAVILVDYPGFNLRLARRVHALGLTTVYYICPQVWAWNRARIPRIARAVDRLLTIFPFEGQYFEGTGLAVDFVGHPLAAAAADTLAAPGPDLPWKGNPRVALLPGSRDHEIEAILPVLWQAAARLEQKHPGIGFLIPAPSPAMAEVLRGHIEPLTDGPSRWDITVGCAREVLRQARAAIVASGTATLEASLMECPTVIVYRVQPLTYWIGRMLIRVKHLGIVNIVAGKTVCPEFLQADATPDALADALDTLLPDAPPRTQMLQSMREVNAALGPPHPEHRAAQIILDLLPPQGGLRPQPK